jgi:tellurite resistance protein TerC
VTFGLIAAGIGYSLWKTKGAEEPDWPAGGEVKSASETV